MVEEPDDEDYIKSNFSNIDGEYYSKNCFETYFRDGRRSIDFVIAYEKIEKKEVNLTRSKFFNLLASLKIQIEIESSNGNIDDLINDPNVPSIKNEGIYKSLFEEPERTMDSVRIDLKSPDKKKSKCRDFFENPGHKFKEILKSNKVMFFAKIYIPWEVMKKYAEILKLRKPIKRNQIESWMKRKTKNKSHSKMFKLTENEVMPITFPMTLPFKADEEEIFEIDATRKDAFFTRSERSLVIDYIMRKLSIAIPKKQKRDNIEAEYGADDDILIEDMSITKMLSDGIFLAAYPLHEPNKKLKIDAHVNTRIMLLHYWASYSKIFRSQPTDYVRLYFGESVAMYFAWLGFYIKALVPISLIGVLVFASSLANTIDDDYLKDICKDEDILMCPECKYGCKFWYIKDACSHTRFTRMLDNGWTVFFAGIVALWSSIFLEFWKRNQSLLAYRWNVHELEKIHEPPRPEFIRLIDTKEYDVVIHPVSNMKEPQVSIRNRVPRILVGYLVTFLAVLISVGFLIANIVYKNYLTKLLTTSDNAFFQVFATTITSITGALLNFLGILILNQVYPIIAKWLNDKEAHRTQTEYDNNLFMKMFCLQFVNYFLSFFYLAFFREITSPLPGDEPYFFQSIPCAYGDCLYDLFIQLLIVFTGKQLNSFLQESIVPFAMKWYKKSKYKRLKKNVDYEDELENETGLISIKNESQTSLEKERWISALNICRHDLTLSDPGINALFPEYLEMMLQYGFITLFVAAFPLAPLFALINNLFELRQDAKKFLNENRRGVPVQAKNIGIWYSFLDVISSLSVRTNALIIAITSQFIPRIVYQLFYNKNDRSLNGYLDFSLSVMDGSRFQDESNKNYTSCKYFDFRTGPEDKDNTYTLTAIWWHIFAFKFIFVLLFENLIIIIRTVIDRIIPDTPKDLKIRIMIENRIIQNYIIRMNDKYCKRCKSMNVEEVESEGAEKKIDPPEKTEKTRGIQETRDLNRPEMNHNVDRKLKSRSRAKSFII